MKNLVIEGDNLTVISTLKNKRIVPWENQVIIKDIKELLRPFTNVCIFQCYREGNQAVDFLACKDCDPSTIMHNPMYMEFHVIIRKNDMGWTFFGRTD